MLLLFITILILLPVELKIILNEDVLSFDIRESKNTPEII
jgi:hypothetical protein